MPIEQTGPVAITLTCDRTATWRRATCAVTLVNLGVTPLLINKRFRVGRADSVARDLYFELLKDESPYLGRLLASRHQPPPLTSSELQLVQVGEAITHWIRLDEYYDFLPRGSYSIRVVYEPQTNETGLDVWTGTVRSNHITLEVEDIPTPVIPGKSLITVARTGPVSVSLACDQTTTESYYGLVTCTVKVTNIGAAPLVLDSRFQIGYEDRGSRDLYFVIAKDGEPFLGIDEFMYFSRRNRLTKLEYKTVQRGTSVTCQLQLEDYYRLHPGSYRIRAVYEPEPCSSHEPEIINTSRAAWLGTMLSNEIELSVEGEPSRGGASQTGPLAVSLTCDRTTTSVDAPATCTITITNIGDSPLLLHNRLAASYAEDSTRDLFFDVLKDGRPYRGSDEWSRDVRQRPLTLADYRLVQPGEVATTRQFRLDGLYRFPPGNYRIRAVYDPEPSNASPNAWSGIARSNEIMLDVVAPGRPESGSKES